MESFACHVSESDKGAGSVDIKFGDAFTDLLGAAAKRAALDFDGVLRTLQPKVEVRAAEVFAINDRRAKGGLAPWHQGWRFPVTLPR